MFCHSKGNQSNLSIKAHTAAQDSNKYAKISEYLQKVAGFRKKRL